jgi:hypothetical protein
VRRANGYHPSMNAVFRTLLIWMLVLGIPLQGVAAATMAFCDSGRHSAAEAAHPHAQGSSTHESVAHASHSGHDTTASLPNPEHRASLSADAGSASSHKCSACASCCSVGALPTTALTVPAPEVSPALFATLAPAVDAFAADGPDRPPRPVQA